MTTFERGRDTLVGLVGPAKADLNEATTRRSILDVMLKDALGWPDNEVRCEEHNDGDYLDYTLGNPRTMAIVEAKRTGLTFEAPAGIESGKIDVSTIRDYSAQNKKAIDQVLNYCQKSGVGIAILSNGHQILAFLGSRADGRKPTEGKAIYYAGIEDMVQEFPRFWDYFSRDGMIRGDLQRTLARSSSTTPPPAPLSSRINGYPGYRIGSEMETDLSILGDLFIQDVVREESITDSFLAECYCSSGALSQYAFVSKEILRTRYQALSEQVATESAHTRRGVHPALRESVVANAMTRRPIVLLGDVGVGKSIFLKHFFRIEAKDMLDKTAVFYIDFLKHSGLLEDVPTHLETAISESLREAHGIDIQDRQFVRAVYNGEINAFKRGIFGDLEESDPAEFRRREIDMLAGHIGNSYEHIRRSLSFLEASRGYSFVVILDNVDQHQPAFQEQIFVAGQAIAETWPAAVFMSLRPDTFHESRRTGALAAYQPRVFTVSPARSDLVVTKRLQFARKELQEFGRLPGFPTGLTLDSESLLIYIDVLLDAFENNNRLIELVDNLSSGNTRRALDFISTFVGSGYVQTERILEAHRTGRSYIVPLHEFIRAILYGDYRYYDPKTSPVPNLFAVSSNDSKEHFLLAILLSVVQSLGEREAGGFAELRRVHAQLQSLGYSPDQVAFHLERAVSTGLMEAVDRGDAGSLVRITSSGAYLYQSLIYNFAYVDAVVVDTPILDPSVRSDIRDVHDISERVFRTEVFMAYLDSCWPFGDDVLPFSWKAVMADWRAALEDVKRGVARAAERRTRR